MKTTRTYGTYRHFRIPGDDRDKWGLTLEPAVRMRARRLFGRVQLTRSMEIQITDTDEVCRDLSWFITRFPLAPADENAARRLNVGAIAHVELERTVGQIMAGEYSRRELPTAPQKTPRDYQLAAVDLIRARKRYLLTDAVGLGKTFTALLNLVHTDALPALVVPPTHLPGRWVTELTEAFPWLTFEVAKKTSPSASAAAGHLADVTIVPYSKLDGWAGYVKGLVNTVIFDEVQDLRTGAYTLKGAAAALVASEAEYVLGLTATPVYNYGGEIWNIYDILAPSELGTREEFTREWGGGATTSGGLMIADPAALGSYLRESGLMLGRTRKEVGRELPKTVKVPMVVESDYAALAEVADVAKALAETILSSSSTGMEKMQAAGEIDWRLRRATGVDKAPYVADFVRLLLESERKVVLFGWHRDVYDIWLEKLADFNPVMYTGTESPKQKADAERRFTTESNIADNPNESRILIMSLRSGAGIDGLQKVARVAVFGELDWSPQVHEQGIGRLRRDGMGDDPPVAYFLYSAEGSDPAMLDVLQVKRQQAEPIVSPDGKLLGNATNDPGRGRRLAEQLLGITSSTEESRSESKDTK